MELNEFNNKKVLILGLGREGQDTLKFLLKWAPEAVWGVADRNDGDKLGQGIKGALEGAKIKRHFGADYLSELDNYDIIIKSPGIPIHLPEIEAAYGRGAITTQTKIFFDHCQGVIIGVTGTKGKSTTSSLIYSVLKEAGFNVCLLGNIGEPVLSYLEADCSDKYYVYELSAHQLFKLDRSPHIAVLINLFPEHLDYYANFDEYVSAKSNIAIHQQKDDYFIYNSIFSECVAIANESVAKKIIYNDFNWVFNGQTQLIGKANLENAKIAGIVGKIFKVDDEKINNAITNFRPLTHRLELVGEFMGIKFYNDSLSTIQESAVAAIDGLGSAVQTLIAGGFDRHQPFDKLAKKILASEIKNLILFRPTGERILKEIEAAAKDSRNEGRTKKIDHFFAGTMDEAVALAFRQTQSGKICLLSAASASFGDFHDYAQRGEAFKDSIRRLSKP